jgi:hypothetical protein
MPRKKCSALASSENGKKYIEEERPEKRMRIGRQAAWAARKYKGHRVLPNEIMEN